MLDNIACVCVWEGREQPDSHNSEFYAIYFSAIA